MMYIMLTFDIALHQNDMPKVIVPNERPDVFRYFLAMEAQDKMLNGASERCSVYTRQVTWAHKLT